VLFRYEPEMRILSSLGEAEEEQEKTDELQPSQQMMLLESSPGP